MTNELNLRPDEQADYQRGFVAGGYVADNQIDKEEWAGIAHELKCEAFKRGYEDGKRHMQSCNADYIEGEEEAAPLVASSPDSPF